MKRKLCFLLAAVMFLLARDPVAWAEDISKIQPNISNPSFIYISESRALAVTLEYAGVAGDITDAKITLVVAVRESSTEERFYAIRFGKSQEIKRTDEYAEKNESITEGEARLFFIIPESVKINEGQDISGFGLALVDSLGRQSRPIFLEVEIEQKTSI